MSCYWVTNHGFNTHFDFCSNTPEPQNYCRPSSPDIFDTRWASISNHFVHCNEINDGICYESTLSSDELEKNIPLSKIKQSQKADPLFRLYYDFIKYEKLPSNKKLANSIEKAAMHLICHNGVLCRLFVPPGRPTQTFLRQVLIPKDLIPTILRWCHNSIGGGGIHLSFEYSLGNLLSKFYFKNCYAIMKDYCKACVVCQKYQGKAPQTENLKSITYATRLSEVLYIDFAGKLSESQGYNYILVAVDELTNFCAFLPTVTHSALECAHTLWKYFCCFYSIPTKIVSDRGSHFSNAVMEEMCSVLKIEHQLNLAWSPRSTEKVERYVGIIKSILARHCLVHSYWISHIFPLQLALNSRSNYRYNGYCPQFLMTGRLVRGHVNIDLGDKEIQENCKSSWLKNILIGYKLASQMLKARHELNAKQFNSKVVPNASFKIGDICYIDIRKRAPPDFRKGVHYTKSFRNCNFWDPS